MEHARIDREKRQFTSTDECVKALGVDVCDASKRLFKQPRFEQRTDPWYQARQLAITASDFAAAANASEWANPRDIVEKKVNPHKWSEPNVFMLHGIEFEDVAVHEYEKRTGNTVLDFGLLSHVDMFECKPDDKTPEEWHMLIHKAIAANLTSEEATELTGLTETQWKRILDVYWLKGSPDGMTTNGILLEIKCPQRLKAGYVRPQYYAQVQLLMEIMDTDACHFVQYVPSHSEAHSCEYDMVVIARDRDWFATHKRKAKETWDAIMHYRRHKELPPILKGHWLPARWTDDKGVERVRFELVGALKRTREPSSSMLRNPSTTREQRFLDKCCFLLEDGEESSGYDDDSVSIGPFDTAPKRSK